MRVLDVALNQHAVVAEGAARLGLAHAEAFPDLGVCVSHTHALAAAARAGLDHHGVANVVGQLDSHGLVLHLTLKTRDDEAVGRFGHLLGVNLVAHGVHGPRRRADEDNSRGLNHVDEFGVFAEEAVAGVDGLCPRLLGHLQDAVHAQVAVARLRAANAVRLIRHAHVHTRCIGLAVHGHRLDAQALRRAHHAACNLAAVRNQYLVEGLRHRPRMPPTVRAGAEQMLHLSRQPYYSGPHPVHDCSLP